ncbi:hypothetical protein D3C72_2598460 [compost metagenome]
MLGPTVLWLSVWWGSPTVQVSHSSLSSLCILAITSGEAAMPCRVVHLWLLKPSLE